MAHVPNGIDDKLTRWKRARIAPIKIAESQTNGTYGNGNVNGNNNNQIIGKSSVENQIINFEIMTWIQIEGDNDDSLIDGDDDDFLDLSKKGEDAPRSKIVEDEESGLSEKDIRGAVGGEAIPGFSSSDAQKKKEPESVKADDTTITNDDEKKDQTPVSDTPSSVKDDPSTPVHPEVPIVAPTVVPSVTETATHVELVSQPTETEPKTNLEPATVEDVTTKVEVEEVKESKPNNDSDINPVPSEAPLMETIHVEPTDIKPVSAGSQNETTETGTVIAAVKPVEDGDVEMADA